MDHFHSGSDIKISSYLVDHLSYLTIGVIASGYYYFLGGTYGNMVYLIAHIHIIRYCDMPVTIILTRNQAVE